MRIVAFPCLALSVMALAYGGWVVAWGFWRGQICFEGHCATLGVLHQGFIPLAVGHGLLALLGLYGARASLSWLRRPSGGR